MRIDIRLLAGYELTVWHDRNPSLAVSQDAWLVTEFPDGRLRVAVLDGCTPGVPGTWRLGLDQAVYASQLARAALLADAPAAACLARAHAELYDATILSPWNRPMSAAIVADLHPGGHVELLSVHDCEAWTPDPEKGWRSHFPDMLTDEGRELFNALLARRDGMSAAEFNVAEAEALGSPDVWRRTAVGQFETLASASVEFELPAQLVLASDGGLLTPERLDRLDGWMDELRAFERIQADTLARSKRSDDVTVLRVRRVTA